MNVQKSIRAKRTSNPAADPKQGIEQLIETTPDPQERLFYEYVRDTFDFARHAALQAKHIAAAPSAPFLKWLDLAHYLQIEYRYVRRLGLDRSPVLNVLDIGCGPAHFSYICKYFGHSVVGLDHPTTSIFNDFVDLLGIERIEEPVTPCKPLPVSRRFDCVTAFHATFFRKQHGILFGRAEWQFFFQDLICRNLTETGRIHLLLNTIEAGVGMNVSSREFADFVAAHGGKVTDRWVEFDDVSKCPRIWLVPADVLRSGEVALLAYCIAALVGAGRVGEGGELIQLACAADRERAALLDEQLVKAESRYARLESRYARLRIRSKMESARQKKQYSRLKKRFNAIKAIQRANGAQARYVRLRRMLGTTYRYLATLRTKRANPSKSQVSDR